MTVSRSKSYSPEDLRQIVQNRSPIMHGYLCQMQARFEEVEAERGSLAKTVATLWESATSEKSPGYCHNCDPLLRDIAAKAKIQPSPRAQKTAAALRTNAETSTDTEPPACPPVDEQLAKLPAWPTGDELRYPVAGEVEVDGVVATWRESATKIGCPMYVTITEEVDADDEIQELT